MRLPQEVSSTFRPRMRELAEEKRMEFEALKHGDSGEDSVETIPFQVNYLVHVWNIFCSFQMRLGSIEMDTDTIQVGDLDSFNRMELIKLCDLAKLKGNEALDFSWKSYE